MLKIFQTFHKPFPKVPNGHAWIQPVSVGRFAHEAMVSDAVGDHISALNPYYCELTAIYWAWKNDRSPYVGFYHYRRYLNFVVDNTWQGPFGFSMPLSDTTLAYLSHDQQKEQALRLLSVCDVVIPRRHAQETSVEAQYLKFHPVEPWNHFKRLISERYPAGNRYLQTFELSNLSTTCNMFLMPRSIFEVYCRELFAVIDPIWQQWGPRWGPYLDRYPGFLAERFLGLWLHMKGLRTMEVPMLLLEPQDGTLAAP